MSIDIGIFNWLSRTCKNKECSHEWKYVGHGHNYSVYKCIRCEEEVEY